MTADEIRKQAFGTTNNNATVYCAIWLQEIAAQLAELNAKIEARPQEQGIPVIPE